MLNQRLQACAAWITDGKTVCDVGTDHAYLAAELLRKERCQHVIASDIGEGPLQAARRTLEQAGLLQRATLLLSDGLEQVDKTDVSHCRKTGTFVIGCKISCTPCFTQSQGCKI